MTRFPKNLVVTGKPGCGKTTLIKEAILPFKDRASGFITEEIREGHTRMGFRLISLDGRQGVLASKSLASPVRLNKYGIDLGVLEGIGISAVKEAMENRRIAVIDEIGSMEVMSEPFRRTVLEVLGSRLPVLATIRLGAQPFTDAVRKMQDTQVLVLTPADFGEARDQVRAWLAWAASELHNA